MNFPSILSIEEVRLKEFFINELLRTNEETKKLGLELTREDANQIVSTRSKVLKNYGRVELGFGVILRLIECFSESAFINEENYAATLNDLQEAFYVMKNETEDELGDEKIIELMKDMFENSCGGSVELLYGSLEAVSKNFRQKLARKGGQA